MLLFFLFPQSEAILPKLNQLLVFVVLSIGVLLVVCELLECITVEYTPGGLAHGFVVTNALAGSFRFY
jgi:hypothetical protein